MTSNLLYDQGVYAWANEKASILRAGRLSEANIANIAAEIGSIGRSEKRELITRLTILLLHLLKWRFQPTHRDFSWRISINNARGDS